MENKKYNLLLKYIKKYNKVAIAYSGGVDSTFLLAASKNAIGAENTLAITIDTPALPRYELEDAQKIANLLGIRIKIISNNSIEDPIRYNPIDRCYHCKKIEFGKIINYANEENISIVFDGSNADDLNDYRPGQKALKELQVISPLLNLGITKAEVREFSLKLGLPTWNKPAYACLYSRIPYNTEIKKDDLLKIERSEYYFIQKGIKTVRVRCHGDLARIEVAPDERYKLVQEPLASEIYFTLQKIGFTYISLDILGYQMGSFNKTQGLI